MPLKLSRREAEGIELTGGITITVRRIDSSSVILEVDAPGSVRITYKHLTRAGLASRESDAHDRAESSQEISQKCQSPKLSRISTETSR